MRIQCNKFSHTFPLKDGNDVDSDDHADDHVDKQMTRLIRNISSQGLPLLLSVAWVLAMLFSGDEVKTMMMMMMGPRHAVQW